MKRLLPVYTLVVFCALFSPARSLCRQQTVIRPPASSQVNAKGGTGFEALIPDSAEIPAKMLDVMRKCQERYLEGSTLIKTGDSAKARIAFDQAVDLILESEWELATTPILSRFFQDLIRNIQRDESRYLLPEAGVGDKPERAVIDELEKVDLIPIQVDPALRDAVEADILNSRYDIPVMVNESVLKSINFWSNRGRRYFIDGLTRSGRYREMIIRIFREESLPLDLMYLAQVESLFKPNAVSRASAKGIWQFGRGTAIRYGLKVNKYIDERSDPEKSTRAAARYLNDLYAMFNDWNLVLAAYNWGEGKVLSLVNKSGETDFWRLTELKRKMPAETKNHVPMIMASIILARNPEKYGLPTELEPPLRCDQVTLTKRISIKAAAKALDISVDLLKGLNPALKTAYSPPDYPGYQLNVPLGMGATFVERLASLSGSAMRSDPEFTGRHLVRAGETLSVIASRYRISVEELQAANDIRSPKSLRAGTWLQVPAAASSQRVSRSVSAPSDPKGEHSVKSGETLAAIARLYGVSITALQEKNSIESAESLRVGTVLKIPEKAAASAAAPKANGVRRHLVQKGDTLSSIAARYGVTVTAIQKLNGIRSPNALPVGKWLQIPTRKG